MQKITAPGQLVNSGMYIFGMSSKSHLLTACLQLPDIWTDKGRNRQLEMRGNEDELLLASAVKIRENIQQRKCIWPTCEIRLPASEKLVVQSFYFPRILYFPEHMFGDPTEPTRTFFRFHHRNVQWVIRSTDYHHRRFEEAGLKSPLMESGHNANQVCWWTREVIDNL